jgi:hypothetical protein
LAVHVRPIIMHLPIPLSPWDPIYNCDFIILYLTSPYLLNPPQTFLPPYKHLNHSLTQPTTDNNPPTNLHPNTHRPAHLPRRPLRRHRRHHLSRFDLRLLLLARRLVRQHARLLRRGVPVRLRHLHRHRRRRRKQSEHGWHVWRRCGHDVPGECVWGVL